MGMSVNRFRGALLAAAWLLAVLSPLIIAGVSGAGGRPGMHDLASTIAMVGFAALLLEFPLSGRFRALTDPVGMDALMRFHQFSGYVVLMLLLLHPYLYAMIPAQADPVAGPMVTDSGGSALSGVTGFIAWFALIGLVFMAIFRDDFGIPYERWRLTHGLGAAAVAVLGLVHTLGAGTAAATPAVAAFWVVAVVLALLTLVHVYAIKPWLRSRRPWRVREVNRLADDIHELRVEPDGHDGLYFRAGQFAWLRIAPSPWGLREHPFSIASAPGDGAALRFLVKANGDYTGRIGEIFAGERAWVDGPYGRFGAVRDDDEALLFVAGGVGLAPMLGLLRERLHAGDVRPMRLVYACRWQRDMVLEDELDELAKQLDLEVIRVVDEETRRPGTLPGPIDRALLEQCLPAVERSRIGCFICAPPGMIDAMETLLVDLGVPPSRIHSERFRYRFGAASPLARRARRAYLFMASLAVLGAVIFAAIR
jgi:predicted ferric reductase